MPAAKPVVEKRGFRINKNAIRTLIGAQAGSLQKAFLEAVANSQDAGATRIDITLSPVKATIQDNGRGFVDKAEIDQFFDDFGFDHEALGREVGRFGVGRGQLFSFGRNRWTTNEFTMDVDIENAGLDYDLITNKVNNPGMKIEIDLYKPLDSSLVLQVQKEFKKLVLFSPIPVFVNGKQVSKDPAKEKWDKETPSAWIKLDASHEISVYSQGLFVQNISSYEFGKGGMVVTKLGHPLNQNLARNDILRDKCPTWKEVAKSIRSMSASSRSKAVSGKAKMTDGLRNSLAMEAMGTPSDEAVDAFANAQLITLTNGKHVRISKMASFGEIACGPDHSAAADRLIQMEQACVISPLTLLRFGVEDAPTLVEALRTQCATLDIWLKAKHERWSTQAHALWRVKSALSDVKAVVGIEDLAMTPSEGFTVVNEKEWTRDEKLAMRSLRFTVSNSLRHCVHSYLKKEGKEVGNRAGSRTIELMVSDTALACTDGATHIWINRPHLAACLKAGAAGFIALSQTMVHELLHNFNSSTGHEHDHEFYEAFHDICLDPEISHWGLRGYRNYLANGGKVSPSELREMERLGELSTEDAVSRHEAMNAVAPDFIDEDATTASPRPKPRKAPGR